MSASFSFDAPKIWNDLPVIQEQAQGIYFWKGLSSLAICLSQWFLHSTDPAISVIHGAYCSKHLRAPALQGLSVIKVIVELVLEKEYFIHFCC